MGGQLERYTADSLLAPAAHVSVMRHEVRSVDVHWHDFYELVHVTSGRAVHKLNGVAHELVPGSTILLTPADFHELVSDPDGPLSYVNVVVEASLLEGRLEGLLPGGLDRPSRLPCTAPELAADFRRLCEESAVRRPGATGMVEAILQCILIELGRRCAVATASDVDDEPLRESAGIRRAVLFVDRHFRESLSLADAAAQAHLSPNYFSERFRQVTGTSFQAYLQQRRLAFAHSLLAATDLGVTEVCRAAGFNSLSHFGRAYRGRYGVAPSASRDVALQQPSDPSR